MQKLKKYIFVSEVIYMTTTRKASPTLTKDSRAWLQKYRETADRDAPFLSVSSTGSTTTINLLLSILAMVFTIEEFVKQAKKSLYCTALVCTMEKQDTCP
jgi:hypothetical protein